MFKKLFSEHGAKNAITLFHKSSSPGSSRILNILKQANATAATSATEDQASSHQAHSDAQKAAFELDVSEGAPTSDQLRNILEYVGETNAGTVIQGASDAADAQRRMRANADSFQRPLVVDWNQGKVVVGENESEILKLLKALPGNS